MITVHHLEYSQSFRVLWLMEELGMPYELKLYERDKKTVLAPPEYKAISPLGTAPVITDADLALPESNAIFDYLLDKYDDARLRPEIGHRQRLNYLFWFHAAQGSLMPMLTFDSVFRILETRVPSLIRPLIKSVLGKAKDAMVKPRIEALLGKAERDLSRHKSAASRGYMTKDYANCHRWLKQMNKHPSFIRALEKSGKTCVVLPL